MEAALASPAWGCVFTAPPTAPSQPADAAPARSRTITAPPVTIIVNLAAIVIISIVINITQSLDAACYRPPTDAAATVEVALASPAWGCALTAPPTTPSQPADAAPAQSQTTTATSTAATTPTTTTTTKTKIEFTNKTTDNSCMCGASGWGCY